MGDDVNRHGVRRFPPPPIHVQMRQIQRRPRRPVCVWPGCETDQSPRYTKVPLCSSHAITVSHQVQITENPGMALPTPYRPAALPHDRPGIPGQRQGEVRPGWIYYLRIDDRIKIGYASILKDRLKSYPPNARLLAAHEGTKDDEAELHKRFRPYRRDGREWYLICEPIQQHVALMAAQHPVKDPRLAKTPRGDGRSPQQKQADAMRWPKPGPIWGYR